MTPHDTTLWHLHQNFNINLLLSHNSLIQTTSGKVCSLQPGPILRDIVFCSFSMHLVIIMLIKFSLTLFNYYVFTVYQYLSLSFFEWVFQTVLCLLDNLRKLMNCRGMKRYRILLTNYANSKGWLRTSIGTLKFIIYILKLYCIDIIRYNLTTRYILHHSWFSSSWIT